MAHGIGLASIHNSMQRLRQPAGPVLGSTPAPPAIWGQEAPNMHCTQRGEGQSLRRTYSNSGLRPGSGLTRNLRPPSQTAGPVLAGLRHQRYLSTTALKDTRHKAMHGQEAWGVGQGCGGDRETSERGDTLAPRTERNLGKNPGWRRRAKGAGPHLTQAGACLCGPKHTERSRGGVRVSEDGTRLQRPSKETGSLADTGRHKWTRVLFWRKGGWERSRGEGTLLWSQSPRTPTYEGGKGRGAPICTEGSTDTGDCGVSPSPHNLAHRPATFALTLPNHCSPPAPGKHSLSHRAAPPSPNLLKCTLFWALLTPQSPTKPTPQNSLQKQSFLTRTKTEADTLLLTETFSLPEAPTPHSVAGDTHTPCEMCCLSLLSPTRRSFLPFIAYYHLHSEELK